MVACDTSGSFAADVASKQLGRIAAVAHARQIAVRLKQLRRLSPRRVEQVGINKHRDAQQQLVRIPAVIRPLMNVPQHVQRRVVLAPPRAGDG